MITMKLVLDSRKDVNGAGPGSMDVAAFYNFDQNIGKVAETYRRGDVVVMANADGEPVSISIADAHSIDEKFEKICAKQTSNTPITQPEWQYMQNYCLRLTLDILKSANAKRLEHEFRAENLQLQHA